MTTIAGTSDVARAVPVWMSWVPRLAVGWAVAYGGVRVWFATRHGPEWKLPTGDLLISDWVSVAACLASAAVVIALEAWPRSRLTIGVAWSVAAGWVAACALILLDFVGGVLPGLGIPFDFPGLLSRLGGLTGAALLAGTALARQRQLNPDCLSCTGRRTAAHETPGWGDGRSLDSHRWLRSPNRGSGSRRVPGVPRLGTWVGCCHLRLLPAHPQAL